MRFHVGRFTAESVIELRDVTRIYRSPLGRPVRAVEGFSLTLLFGGVGFLLSAITEYDWIALGAAWSLAWLVRSLFPADASWYGRALDLLLPPLHLLAGAAVPLLSGAGIGSGNYLWIVGNGTAAFVAGLLVVRYRPMAS